MSDRATHGRQRGLSIIEFMVGLAVGMFVVGGAAKLFVDYLGTNRSVLLETRVNQDLRAAADLVVRDLRRASYWADASTGLGAGASAPLNPFRAITVSNNDLTVGDVAFTYDKAASAAETAGFRVRNGALQFQLGAGNWQPVTDPAALVIDTAQLDAPVLREVPLHMSCPCIGLLTCAAASFTIDPATSTPGVNYANRPRMTIRQYTLTLRGHAPDAPAMRREVRESVRVRNDEIEGGCPT